MCGQAVDLQPSVIDRHGYHLRPIALECRQGTTVTGIFDGDRRSGPHEETRDNIQRFLNAVDDQHLRCPYTHSAGRAEVLGDRMTQLQQSRRMRIFGERRAG